jgi:hypothetical protein
MVTVHKCKECEQTFLSWKEFEAHIGRHLQKHLDEYTPGPFRKEDPPLIERQHKRSKESVSNANEKRE